MKKKLDPKPLDRLTNRIPDDPNMQIYSAADIVASTSEFIRENFRGLAEVTNRVDSILPVKISAEYFAYFIKLLLKYTKARSFLSIDAKTAFGELVLTVTPDEKLPFSYEEFAYLAHSAKNAGFAVAFTETHFILKAKYVNLAPTMYVYTGRINILNQTFKNIFFTS